MKNKLQECLMRGLAALFELAWRNRRMTAKGVVALVVFFAARRGFDIPPDAQAYLAGAIIMYLGIVGRDKRRPL